MNYWKIASILLILGILSVGAYDIYKYTRPVEYELLGEKVAKVDIESALMSSGQEAVLFCSDQKNCLAIGKIG